MRDNFDIFDGFDNIFDDIERTVRGYFGSFAKALPYDSKSLTTHRTPVTKLDETEKEIRLNYEIPGFDKKDIDLELLSNNRIKVSAEKKEETKNKKSYSKFYREITLPSEINPDNVNATYKNGVLEVILQKSEKEKQSKKLIEIK